MKINFRKDKELYKRIGVLTLPIILQNIIDAAVNSADVLMLNYVGQSAISATSLATYYANLCFMFLYGIGTGVSMLAAQYWGKKDKKTVEAVSGIGLRFALIIAVMFMAFTLLAPQTAMKIFTSDPELIALGSRYLVYSSPAIICWSISFVYMSILRSIGKTGIATVLEAIALVLNVSLNAVFIFGLFGVPKLGVIGVAIATAISRFTQLVACIAVAKFNKECVGMGFLTMFERHKALNRDFFTMALPAIGNDVAWSTAFSMYGVILGHLGTDAVAANSIVNVVRNLGTVFCYGIGSASGIIVGQILGEDNIEEAKRVGRILLRLSVMAGIVGGLIVFAVRPFALATAHLTPTSLDYLSFMLLINTYYITGTAVNTTLIAGIFRAGGDSKFGFICDTIDMWVYAVPLGLLAAFVFKLPVKWVYFLLCTDEFVKWPWVFKNFYSYKWAKNITRDNIDQIQ